jgi:hypothetical protein
MVVCRNAGIKILVVEDDDITRMLQSTKSKESDALQSKN